MKVTVTRIVLVSLFFMAGCSTQEKRVEPKKQTVPKATTQTIKLYNGAKKLFDRGQNDAALQRLNQLLKIQPNSDLTDNTLILKGRIFFKQKNFALAYEFFQDVFSSANYSERENEARILGVQSLLAMNKVTEAQTLIHSSLRKPLRKREKVYLLEAYLPILLKKGAYLDSVESMAYLSQFHPNSLKREKYRRLTKSQIDNHLQPADLQKLSENAEAGEFRTEAMFQYAVEQLQDNNLSVAKRYFRSVVRTAPSSYLGLQSSILLKQLDNRASVEAKSVGVILPLTGQYHKVGKSVLNGLKLALGINGSISSNGLRLIVKDSQSSETIATQAVEDLVLKDQVIAIVGGLLSKTALAEVTKSQQLGVPFLSLSQSSGLTKVGPFVFRMMITPKLQMRELIKTAKSKYGSDKFAVLYPNDKYGVNYSNLFWDEVLLSGGDVVGAQAYKSGETDFKDHIKKLVGTYYIDDRRTELATRVSEWKKKNRSSRRRPPEDLLPPIINWQALFIPDDPKTIGQIAPLLAFYNISNVYLMGTNLWNSPELIRRGQSFVENSLFLDTLLNQSSDYKQGTFYRSYVSQFRDRPGTFATQGFDTGRILMSALEKEPATRLELMQKLLRVSDIDGAVSKLSINDQRELQRPLFALTVKKGKISEIQ